MKQARSATRLRGAALALALAVPAGLGFGPTRAAAQSATAQDAVLAAIDQEATANSQVRELAQVLLDSIGPRLTGSPGMEAAGRWALGKYAEWGIEARNEQYGTWDGWRRGVTHVDLLEPRVRTLNATMLAWSAGTGGPVTGEAVLFPRFTERSELEAWLATVAGKVVLMDAPDATCRPIENWEAWARPETVARVEAAQEAAGWTARTGVAGVDRNALVAMLERANVAAAFTSDWSEGWGASKIYSAASDVIPFINLSCEDYGLVARLAERGQSPLVRVEAESESLGRVPVHNTIATLPGEELPDEYVILSAHFDSWDGASGATDNGTGTVVMMEAMRILKATYPNPRRTIMVGHWNGEEQGIHGSAAFAADHPEIVEGLQVVLNQDNGTGRIETIQMEGFANTAEVFREWLARVPAELAGEIEVRSPGTPSGGSSDHSSFICRGAPAFFLRSRSWDYGTYTWHTDLDTFDKIAFDEVRDNARLVAMLAYLASEHPEQLSRERAVEQWPACRVPVR